MRLARQAPDVAQNVAQRTHFGPKAMTRAGACGHDRRAVCAYLPKFTSQQLCKGKLASAFEAFFEDGSRSCCVMACILHFCSIRKPKLKAYYETGMKSIVLVFDPNNALGKILLPLYEIVIIEKGSAIRSGPSELPISLGWEGREDAQRQSDERVSNRCEWSKARFGLTLAHFAGSLPNPQQVLPTRENRR